LRTALLLRRLVLLALCAFFFSSALIAQPQSKAPTGWWNGTIQSKAGEVNFGIDLETKPDGTLQATLVNATDRQPFSSAEWKDGTLTLRMDYYDGVLAAHMVSPQRMAGEYSRQTSKGMVHIPVSLTMRRTDSQPPKVLADCEWTGPTLSGEWIFTWPEENGAEKTTRASFQQEKITDCRRTPSVTGTIQPVSGDTGLLHGEVTRLPGDKTHFHLSRFDGIHVMAINGELLPDGSIKGQQGGIRALEDFTAVRATDTKTADPNVLSETLTTVKDPAEPFRFSGVDSSGKTLNQDSPEFKGKALIIDIFGTWCPNCHDEAPVLEKLYRKYHDQGLEIVGLAYEYVDDTQRDFKQIAIYREKFGITFPLLLAGTTDQGQIAKTLPQLVNFGAFPTSIYVDRSGKVRAILAGFTGPSTGEKFQQVQQRMGELTRQIVASPN